ncbi:hypothetical protein SDC9_120870 [bioreactor metagenome]|uniref:Radical SAM core domain-containing protein n=1 Tax=bioreactor metagenome TaxID=1076179 RepID=A0A645CAD3_9ZZZZ
MNLYRGCTHGCIYCDSRSACYGMEHAFEDVEVKGNAPRLLEEALRRKRGRCMIGTGSMCDPYLPLEEQLGLTRSCLELVARYGFGFTVITKSDLILRDLALLKKINESTKCVVQMTLTTFDETLCRILEPNVCTTARRAEVLNILRDEGIPTVVWLSPILPFLNDTEENLRGILSYCFEAQVRGIVCFDMGVTLREGDREYFYAQLDRHFPGMKQRYIQSFGNSYSCSSPYSGRLMALFQSECRKRGVLHQPDAVFAYLSAFEDRRAGEQISLF